MTHKMEPAEIFSWHDGVVVALVKLTWMEGTFLASLVSWSLDKQRRVFALISIDPSDAENIRKQATRSWPEFLAFLHGMVEHYEQDVTLVHVDEALDAIVAKGTVAADAIRAELFGDVEDALSDERQRWQHP